MDLRGRHAFITGGSGAVGSVVIERLAREGMAVRALARRPGSIATHPQVIEVLADLAEHSQLAPEMAPASLVVHCAAQTSNDFAESVRINIEGTRRVVEGAIAAHAQLLIHISTVSVYALDGRAIYDEQSPLCTRAADPYAYTKAEAEQIVRAAAQRGLPSVILRPVIVLSMHPRSFWGPQAIERARASADSIVPVRDIPYVHVDNLADAIVLAATHAAAIGQTYNVVDGIGHVEDYSRALYARLGRPPPRQPENAPPFRFSGDKLRRELGYAPADRWREFLAELAG